MPKKPTMIKEGDAKMFYMPDGPAGEVLEFSIMDVPADPEAIQKLPCRVTFGISEPCEPLQREFLFYAPDGELIAHFLAEASDPFGIGLEWRGIKDLMGDGDGKEE